jgi:hypothetical protein
LGVERHAPVTVPPRKRRGTYLQDVGWVPGRVCKGAKDIADTGTRCPELLYKIVNGLHRLPPRNLSQILSKFGTIKPILYMAATVLFYVAHKPLTYALIYISLFPSLSKLNFREGGWQFCAPYCRLWG